MKRLDSFYKDLKKYSRSMAGYPENQIFDYSELYRFLEFSINNCGDPFQESSTYHLNTHIFERELIDAFARLFHAPKNRYWGYVTNGGTEGNLFGLRVAREIYPEGKVYCSDQTHYSIHKNVHLLRMESVQVKSLPNGEIDYAALKKTIAKHPKSPPIIIANIGTTMKGAIDSVNRIRGLLKELGISKYFLHCDAALSGMVLPYLPPLKEQAFDFRAGIDSLAISGHKMIGMPIPCGVALVKKSHAERISEDIEYTGTRDNTITGSRNGITPLFLWYKMVFKKFDLKKLVRQNIERAEYAVKKFQAHNIDAWRNPNSFTVVFPRPSEKTRIRWQLAVEDRIAHIITQPQVTCKVIDQIVADVAEDLG